THTFYLCQSSLSWYYFSVSCVWFCASMFFVFFFFNDTATTEIYTLSLHDALPISLRFTPRFFRAWTRLHRICFRICGEDSDQKRSEEHTSELQSPCNLVCRLLLEKKKKNKNIKIVA